MSSPESTAAITAAIEGGAGVQVIQATWIPGCVRRYLAGSEWESMGAVTCLPLEGPRSLWGRSVKGIWALQLGSEGTR